MTVWVRAEVGVSRDMSVTRWPVLGLNRWRAYNGTPYSSAAASACLKGLRGGKGSDRDIIIQLPTRAEDVGLGFHGNFVYGTRKQGGELKRPVTRRFCGC